jgi:alanine racemase
VKRAADSSEPALTLTIDLAALVANWRELSARSRPARASAVVKADGYGLGIAPVVDALHRAGCRDFFTATVEEARQARSVAPHARIFVLNGLYAGIEAVLRQSDLIPVLASLEQVALWRTHCLAHGPHPFALQIDTGMNRLGLRIGDALAWTRNGTFDPTLVISHLACADEPTHAMNRLQQESFQQVAAAFAGIESSLCNSAGIFLGGDFLHDLTRPGIAIYGGEAVDGVSNPMLPVATARARILQIRQASAGETVSYGGAERLGRDSRIAVCAVGYADGYPRSASGAGVPLRKTGLAPARGFVAGTAVPVLGRVTMDLTMFDITDAPAGAVSTGDFIELFGPNMPLDDLARAAGTIGYEILTSIGARYRRSLRGQD